MKYRISIINSISFCTNLLKVSAVQANVLSLNNFIYFWWLIV